MISFGRASYFSVSSCALFINKGYAVFKQIQILCESEEYYIVETGNDYGLANYDHIALVGKDVQENDIVF